MSAMAMELAGPECTVLLVDDDPTQLKLCRIRLEDEGFLVRTAASGEEALGIALSDPPDAIVSDVLMGELDGFGLCRKIRETKRLARVPVILLSAHYNEPDAQALASRVGASGLATRTSEFDQEVEMLRAALGSSHHRSARVTDTVLYEEHLRTNANQITKLLSKVKSAEERYRTLFENAHDAIAILSPEGVILDANQRWSEVLGVLSSELIGRRIQDFAPPGTENANRDARSIAGPAGRSQAVALRRSDGTVLYLEFSNTAIDVDGQPLIFAIGRDVTESVVSTEALKEAEARYRSLVERLPDVIWTAKSTGEFLFVTPNVEAISGYTIEELRAGGLGLWLSRIQESERSRALSALQSGSAQLDVEYRWQRKDQTWIWIRSRTIAKYDRAGVTYCDGMFSDVTEKKQLEESFRQAQKMEAIGQFTGAIAHDFNNILAAILANSHFLLEALAEHDPRHADAEEIKVAGEKGAALTRQLLAFSRKQVLKPAIIDLNATVSNLEKMLIRLIGEDIEFSLVPGAELGSVRIDASQLEQLIMNLVVNARDAMPTGGKISIETSNVELDEHYAATHAPVAGGHYVMLAVSDTGCGMDGETQSRIFEPFFTTKGLGRGTGLGLSTCYGIVKQSGGSIGVYSELGRGTVFKIYLPRVNGQPDRVVKPGPIAIRGGRETILLVEDDDHVRIAVERMLEQRGYRVLVAKGGFEGIELARQFPGKIHLILSDVVMPGACGPEVAEQLGPHLDGVRALFMSGYTDHAAFRSGLIREGMNFIQKPFVPEALDKKIREVLDQG